MKRRDGLDEALRINDQIRRKNGKPPVNPPPRAGKPETPTDDELRDRFLSVRPETGYGLGQWRRYGNGVWSEADELEVKRDIAGVIEAAKPEGVKPSANKLASVAELTRVQVAVRNDLWDANPDILVCANGALDLQTGKLMPHAREHHATAAVPYAYDPDAYCEAWEQRVMGEAIAGNLGMEAVMFLQEFAGYCLTPDTGHEIGLWLTGTRGGGRSTIIAGLEAMLGLKAGVLSLSDIERSTFALSNLPGKTMVSAAEQPSVFMRGGGVVNSIISGDRILLDRKYRDPVEVVSHAKIVWAMNELPREGNMDDGIFRRVKVLELPEIPSEARDPKVKEGVKAGRAVILNWSLEGLKRVRQRGRFGIPKTVKEATEDFREANDVPNAFVEDACDLGEGTRPTRIGASRTATNPSRAPAWRGSGADSGSKRFVTIPATDTLASRSKHRASARTRPANEECRVGGQPYTIGHRLLHLYGQAAAKRCRVV